MSIYRKPHDFKPETISVWKSLKKKRMSLLGENSITLDVEEKGKMTKDEELEFNEMKVFKEMSRAEMELRYF